VRLHSIDLHPMGAAPWAAPVRPRPVPFPVTSGGESVVVVGAGIAGLSAAWHLARGGAGVMLLDDHFGGGATARSGGIVLGETLAGRVSAFEHCERDLVSWIREAAIACDCRWTQCYELERDPALPADLIDWTDDGPLRAARAVNGALVDPVKLLNGLADNAARVGVTLLDGTRVADVAASASGVRLVTSRGNLDAEFALLAVDAVSWAASAQDEPFPDRTLTVALETTPIDADSAASAGLDGVSAFYTSELPLLWGRPTTGGRYLFGRELVAFPWSGSVSDESRHRVERAGERLLARVRRLHPALHGVVASRIWAGPTARNASGVPAIVADRSTAMDSHVNDRTRVFWMGGCGGHGLAQSFRLGAIAARRMLRRVERRVMAR
jgi:glycine/D-amino acid oxidase-like deaminating enzyme